MSRYQSEYLKHFHEAFTPAQAAIAEIAGTSLSPRQRHALDGVLHALTLVPKRDNS